MIFATKIRRLQKLNQGLSYGKNNDVLTTLQRRADYSTSVISGLYGMDMHKTNGNAPKYTRDYAALSLRLLPRCDSVTLASRNSTRNNSAVLIDARSGELIDALHKESDFTLRNAWHAIRGFLDGDTATS